MPWLISMGEAGRDGRNERERAGEKDKKDSVMDRYRDKERNEEQKGRKEKRRGMTQGWGQQRTDQNRSKQQNKRVQDVPSTTLNGALVRSCRAMRYITVATARSPPECLEPDRSTIPLSCRNLTLICISGNRVEGEGKGEGVGLRRVNGWSGARRHVR
jgi:hypothetical protein